LSARLIPIPKRPNAEDDAIIWQSASPILFFPSFSRSTSVYALDFLSAFTFAASELVMSTSASLEKKQRTQSKFNLLQLIKINTAYYKYHRTTTAESKAKLNEPAQNRITKQITGR
jgi:hypothetical protein